MKKILLILATLLFWINIAFGNNEKVNIYLFWWDGCPHCAKEKEYLWELKKEYNNISIKDYEVWYNQDNWKLLQKVWEKINQNITGVPFTVIWKQTISWFLNEDTTGKEIENAIKYCIENDCEDIVWELLECDCNPLKWTWEPVVKEKVNTETKNNIENLNLPIFGNINVKDFSLPAITILLWFIDWFNPCAMWILLFLISMLIWMKDKRKMWILWSIFILSSAIAYFLFITAWLKIILFFGFLLWIKLGIGMFAIVWWSYNLKEFMKNKDGWCSVVGEEKRSKMFAKIKEIIHKKSFIISSIWIVILAFAVNIVELLCSAWIPVIFTQILTINNLSDFGYYSYILLYIVFFMLDDFIVFVISMITLQVTWITTKYTKYSHLIGWIIMIIIWILLIFKPNLLMFW